MSDTTTVIYYAADFGEQSFCGNRLQTLCKTFQPPGSYTEAMPALPAGLYYVQLRTIRSVVTIPVVVLP